MNNADMRRKWWSRHATETYLGISRARVRQLVADGRLDAKRDSRGHTKVYRDSVLAYALHRHAMGYRSPAAASPTAVRFGRSVLSSPAADGKRKVAMALVLEKTDVIRIVHAVDARWDGVNVDDLVRAIEETRDVEREQGETVASLQAQANIERLERELQHARAERDKWRARSQIEAREQRYRRERRSKSNPLSVLLIGELSRHFSDRNPSDEELSDEIMRLMQLPLSEFYRPPGPQ